MNLYVSPDFRLRIKAPLALAFFIRETITSLPPTYESMILSCLHTIDMRLRDVTVKHDVIVESFPADLVTT